MTNTSATALAKSITDTMDTLASVAVDLVSPTPGRVVKVAPGEIVAWDDCCDGQLWVRLVNLTPSDGATPARRPGMDVCATPWFIGTFELGLVRCAAVVDDRGIAPSALQVTTDGVQSVNDMAQLMAALKCSDIDVRSLTGWTPQGPEGGCHGGFWTFTLRLSNCLTCPPPEPEPEPEDPDTPEEP